MLGIETALLQRLVIGFGLGRQGKESPEQLLLAGVTALREQRLGVIRVFFVLVSVVAAWMACDEFLPMVDTEPILIDLQGQDCAGILRRHRITVGIVAHPETAGGTYRQDRADIIGVDRPGLQAGLLLGEQIHRTFMGLAMNAHIGNGLQPDPRCRIQVAEIGDLQAVEEIFLYITDSPIPRDLFHSPCAPHRV